MSMRLRFVLVLVSLVASAGLFSGCGGPTEDTASDNSPETSGAEQPQDDYDPHDKPLTEEQKAQLLTETATLPAALSKIAEFRDTVQRETADGIPENPYETHQALDRADFVLERLAQIASDSDVPRDHWEEVNTTATDLRNLFEQVHQNIDSQQDPDFASVADDIDQKISRLQEIVDASASGDNGSEK